jgi:hypothetical protein
MRARLARARVPSLLRACERADQSRSRIGYAGGFTSQPIRRRKKLGSRTQGPDRHVKPGVPTRDQPREACRGRPLWPPRQRRCTLDNPDLMCGGGAPILGRRSRVPALSPLRRPVPRSARPSRAPPARPALRRPVPRLLAGSASPDFARERRAHIGTVPGRTAADILFDPVALAPDLRWFAERFRIKSRLLAGPGRVPQAPAATAGTPPHPADPATGNCVR